jgi:hypothetical protein
MKADAPLNPYIHNHTHFSPQYVHCFVQTLWAFCSASVVTLPTTLLLLTSCSKCLTCAPRDSLWCFAGHLDTVAYLATRRQPCTDRLFQIELSALTFVLAFVALFCPRGKPNGTKLASDETVCAGVAVPVGSRPEGPSHPQASPDRPHTPDTRTLVTRAACAWLYTLRCPSYRGKCLGGRPWLRRSPLYPSPWRRNVRHTRR